jgi:hypothetical protein
MSMRTHDQRRLSGTEADAALRYAEIAAAKGLKVTLFATGRSVAEEEPVFREIAGIPGVELGGHGFRGRRPRWLYEFVFRRLLGRMNGPGFYQAREIAATVRVFRERLGRDVRSWRDHAYRHDRNTFRLLAAAGLEVVSDELGTETAGPRVGSGLVSLPVNVWPDHDCLAHGVYTGAVARSAPAAVSGLPPRYLAAGEWLEAVVGQVGRIEGRGGIATLLVHPACMSVLDGLRTFASLCSALSGRRSATATEAAAGWAPGGGLD